MLRVLKHCPKRPPRCFDPRKQAALVAVLGVCVPLWAVSYAVFKSWPAVHLKTDVGSLLGLELANRDLYSRSVGCGQEEAAAKNPDFEAEYNALTLWAVDACGRAFASLRVEWMALGLMVASASASSCLLVSACSYRLACAIPWIILQVGCTTAAALSGFLFLVAFRKRIAVNEDDVADLEEWDRQLGSTAVDFGFFVTSVLLKLWALKIVATYVSMLLPPKSDPSAAATAERTSDSGDVDPEGGNAGGSLAVDLATKSTEGTVKTLPSADTNDEAAALLDTASARRPRAE